MALTNNDIRLLLYAKKLGVSYEKTLMLGRLKFYGDVKYLLEKAAQHAITLQQTPVITDGYSEPVLQSLGAINADSMDVSNYENATIIHDLNTAVPENLHQRYNVIIDGGTLEHIFNFPQAILNCMNMLKTGGHFIGITPVNNLMGHGFYQFSPELYFRVFGKENGFAVKKMLITAVNTDGSFNDWYEVADPQQVHGRVVMMNQLPTYLMVIAEKKSDVRIFAQTPQQSDYTETWSKTEGNTNADSGLRAVYKMIVPQKLRDVMYAVKTTLKTKDIKTKDLGALNSFHFKKTDF